MASNDELHQRWLRVVNEAAEAELRAYCRPPLVLEPLRWAPSSQFPYQRVDVSKWPEEES